MQVKAFQKIKDLYRRMFGAYCPTCRKWYFDRDNKMVLKNGIECIGCDHVRGDVQDQQRADAEDLERFNLEGFEPDIER